jgi:hypothetical protein
MHRGEEGQVIIDQSGSRTSRMGGIEGMQTWVEAMTSQSRAICYPAWLMWSQRKKLVTKIYIYAQTNISSNLLQTVLLSNFMLHWKYLLFYLIMSGVGVYTFSKGGCASFFPVDFTINSLLAL